MALRKSKRSNPASDSFSPERSRIRALLKKASRGNAYAFIQSVSGYIDFISEYLFLLGITDSRDRIFHIQQLLTDCWRYLPYTRRVSDFERFLQVQLERIASDSKLEMADPHRPLATLNHKERFLLSARILENWSYKSLKLSLRVGKRELSTELMNLKCKLCEFPFESLKPEEQLQVLKVSELLEGELSDNAARRIETDLAEHYHAHQFKAEWLSYRCELADLRIHMLITADQVNELKERTTALLKQQPMEQPRLADSLINQISFVRLPLQ